MYIVDNATLPNTTSKCTYYSIYGPILFHRRGKVEAIKKHLQNSKKETDFLAELKMNKLIYTYLYRM